MTLSAAPATLHPRAALLVIDVQETFLDAQHWGPRDNPACGENISALLAQWREKERPVVFVRHESSDPESTFHPHHPGHAFQGIITGTPDLLVTKSVNSSFHGTPDLDSWLRENGISELFICGITTNHCCETTARVGGNLGYRVLFVRDATHTFDRTGPDGQVVAAAVLSRITGVNLHGEFAAVVTTADVLAVSDAPDHEA